MKNIKSVFFIFMFIFFSCNDFFCIHGKSDAPKKQITMVVFVHGIISIVPHLSFGTFFRFWHDEIHNTVYERAVYLQRRNPFFYQYHTMQEIGLQKIDTQTIRPGAASAAFARSWDKIEKLFSYNDTINQYYTYGWSGLLSPKMRTFEAKLFLKELLKEVKRFHEKNISVNIKVIAYSNGGNMALSTGKIFDYYKPEFNLLAGLELILIGTPITQKRDYTLSSELFSKIYNIYSMGDRVQRLDIFSPGSLLAQRTFHETPYFHLSEKLVQINYEIRRPSTKYLRKINEGYCSRLSPRHLRQAHAGHSEIWSFGWVTRNYRPHFPLYPLPAASMIPILLYAANLEPCLSNHLVIDVRPFQEIVITKPYRNKKQKRIIPFLTKTELQTIIDDALQFRPNPWSHELYQEHITAARKQAEKEKKWERKQAKIKQCY